VLAELAAHGQDLQMGGRLPRGQQLADRFEFVEGLAAAGPADGAGHSVGGRLRAAAHRVQRLGQPVLMVREQFLHPRVRAVGHRPVRREQPRVRYLEHETQRREIIPQRQRVPHRFETDRRRDARKHMVSGEQHRAGRVVEDEMAAGVAGGVDGAQRPGLEHQVGPVRYPAVGILPFVDGGAQFSLAAAEPRQQLARAHRGEVSGERAGVDGAGGDEVVPLVLAE
jgi:hypothetical protein